MRFLHSGYGVELNEKEADAIMASLRVHLDQLAVNFVKDGRPTESFSYSYSIYIETLENFCTMLDMRPYFLIAIKGIEEKLQEKQ